jgi:predicted amidohydrolase
MPPRAAVGALFALAATAVGGKRPSSFLLTTFQPRLDTLSPSPASQLASLSRAAAAAGAARANLLVVPELFLTGYNLDAALDTEPRGGPRYAAAGALARENNISIVFTYAERGADGRTYDAAVLFGRDGAPRLDYRKTNLASGEGLFLTPGDVIGPVVEVDGVRVGVLICFDVFLPEPARILALSSADLIVVPTANGYPPSVFNQVADLIVPARALENSAFVAYVNYVQVGPPAAPFPEIWTFYGRTTVADPGGNVIYTGPSDAEAIAHTRLNFSSGGGPSTAIGRPAADTRGLCDAVNATAALSTALAAAAVA